MWKQCEAARLMGVLLVALAMGACGSPATEQAATEGEPPPVSARGPDETVFTARAERGEIRHRIMTSGSIVARRTTALGPSVPGRILHIFVEVGDEVQFGAPVFQIDPGPYAIGLREAEAGLALARAQAAEAREEERRTSKLAAKNMISPLEHRRARTRSAVSAAHVEQAEAGIARVKQNLGKTLVLAPYAGSIVERRTHEGTMGTVTPNTVVVVLQETGNLEAVLDVPEASQMPVHVGDGVRLFIEGVPDAIESQVRAVNRKIDLRTRTYAIRAPVDHAGETVKSGAFVRAEVEPTARQGALLVDRGALARQDGAAFVFRVRDGVAERVPIRVGVVGPRSVEILGGIEQGDEVVVGDVIARLMDGARVIVAGEAPTEATEIASTGETEARP
jgi:RND family efflux transporter MFP subunit